MGLNETAPIGVSPAYYHESKQPLLEGICTLFITVTIATAALRVYARRLADVPLWWDDWFALASVPFCVAIPVLNLVQLRNGLGRHDIVLLNTNPTIFSDYYRNLFVILIVYTASLAFFKLSVLALYCRIFGTSSMVRWSSYGLATGVGIWIVFCEFLHIFRCNPISYQWNPTEDGSCIMTLAQFNLINSIPTVFFHSAILVLPLPIVWKIQMPTHMKIAVTSIFMLGGLVLIVSIMRLVRIIQYSSEDPTYVNVDLCFWSTAEPVAGLLSCSLMSYSPFYHAIRKRLPLSSNSNPQSRKPSTESLQLDRRHFEVESDMDKRFGANVQAYPVKMVGSSTEELTGPESVYHPPTFEGKSHMSWSY